MGESKNQSGAKANKNKSSLKVRKPNSNANGIPLLRFGANTNLHVWKQKLTVKAMQLYGDLARLLEDDEYYVPPMVTLEGSSSSSQHITIDADDSSDKETSSSTRSSKRTTKSSSSVTQEQSSTMSSELGDIELEMKKIYLIELHKNRAKLMAKMESDRTAFYAFMIDHLSRESLDEVKKDDKYDVFFKARDPLGLWLAIKRTHKIGSDSGVSVIKKSDARLKYANAKQGSYESITAYKERFDYLVDAYVTAGNAELADEDLATDYLRSLDDSRYRELKINIENDELMGYNKIPKTLSAMHALACNFKVMKKSSVTNHGTSFATTGSTTKANNSRPQGGRDQQKASNDSSEGGDQRGTSSGSKKGKKGRKPYACFRCGSTDHLIAECPEGDMEVVESKAYCTQTTKISVTADRVRHCKVFAVPSKKIMPWNMVLLDNQSDVSIVDERLLKNVRQSSVIHSVSGMGPVPLVLDKVGELEGFFECAAGTDLKANVLCQADVEDKFPITWTQGVSYIVHHPRRDIVFKRIDKRYVADMRDWRECCTMVTTVSENESRYTKQQVARARGVRELLKNMGYPSQEEAIKLISDGNIAKIPYTTQDIRTSYEIYGPPTEYVRGKKTMKKVSRQPVDNNLREGHYVSQTMYGDVMYVRKKAFLITVSMPLGLVLVTPIQNTVSETLGYAVQEQVNTLRSRGFSPRIAYLDGQPGFSALVGNIPGVEIDTGGAGDHVDRVDERIRRVKEMIRSVHSGLPWQLPNMMIKDLVKYCVSRINLKRPNNSTAEESPRVAFTGRKPNFIKELSIGFGDYCEVYQNNVKSNDACQDRTVPCIALWPAGNATGSWWMLNTKTNKRMRSSNWTKLVTNDMIIRVMNNIAESEADRSECDLLPDMVPVGDSEVVDEMGTRERDIERMQGPSDDQRSQGREDYCEPIGRVEEADDQKLDPESDVIDMQPECNQDDVLVDNGVTDGVHSSSVLDKQPSGETEEIVTDDCLISKSVVVPHLSGNPKCVAARHPSGSLESAAVPQHSATPNSVVVPHPSGAYEPVVAGAPSGDKEEHVVFISKGILQYFCAHLSVNKGFEMYGSEAYKAVLSELKQLILDKNAYHPVHRSELTPSQLKQVMRSFMFLKEKFDAAGRFEKLKARQVGNGAQQDRKLHEDVSSPTVKLESVMIMLSVAAANGGFLIAVDIGGAYLNADMSGEDIYMEIDPFLTKFVRQIDPSVTPFVDQKGRLTVKLDKALYGCIQSAKLWYETLTKYLRSIGFSHNEIDPCVMIKIVSDGHIIIAIYVDDILIWCTSERLARELISDLKSEYKEVKVSEPGNFSYLGMHIIVRNEHIVVSMQAYVRGVLADYPVTGSVTSPATGDLFKVGESAQMSESEAKIFHTVTAKLLYLSKRARPDIMLAVAYLTTRVKGPNLDDGKKLKRVMKYLNGSVARDLVLHATKPLRVEGYIDAAFGLHDDGKSHTGMVITVGGATVMCKSSKQKMVTRDSTEAELVGLSDRVSDVLQCHDFIIGLGFQLDMPIIYQDNNSTLTLVKNGGGKYRSKHLKVRQAQIKEFIDNKALVALYLSTKLMLGDPLSKPLQGNLFRYLTSGIFGERRLSSQGRADRYGLPSTNTGKMGNGNRDANK